MNAGGQDPDRRGEPTGLSSRLGDGSALWHVGMVAVDMATGLSARRSWSFDCASIHVGSLPVPETTPCDAVATAASSADTKI